MINSTFLDYLHNNDIRFKAPVNTANLVSFKIGGTGSIAVFPKSISELSDIINLIKAEKYVILGNGTNCYFTNSFYDGIIVVTKDINKVSVLDNIICAECGAAINTVCKIALSHSLSGLEFSYGIPGTIGGAIYMNASAYGGSFSDVVIKSTALDIKTGEIVELNHSEHEFNVKASVFQGGKMCLLRTCFELKSSKNNTISQRMDDIIKQRAASQPLNMPSAGSTFIKPRNDFASRLIDKAGLKGYTVGGAQVSRKHAGFIVNLGNATATDVLTLIEYIKYVVFKRFGVMLNEEILYLD